ncbi:MAG TPA: hypothetical protein VL595_18315 [Pseudonocardia sp.]|nr:hypothetical protein [Pseudonocardia sp.]
MSVLQTVLVFVLVPLGLFVVISLLAAGRRRQRPSRYRPGEPWRHEPVWWTANPAGAPLPEEPEHVASAGKGGAEGGW